MLAPGKSMPAPLSTIEGRTVTWSQFAYLGGDQIYSGSALFTKFQGAWQPKIIWVRGSARMNAVITNYDNGRTYIVGFDEQNAPATRLVTAGAVQVGSSLGTSSFLSGTGVFMTTAGVTTRIVFGAGIAIAEGVDLGLDGLVVAAGLVVAEGVVPIDGIIIVEGLVVAEGMVIAEGLVISEQGPMPGE
jgi:hypothetical protein